MANKRISELTSITGANLADADLLVVVDVSDTTMASSGTNKKVTLDEFAQDSTFSSRYAPLGADTRLFIPAGAMGPINGSPTYGSVATTNQYGGWLLDSGSEEAVGFTTLLPTWWVTFHLDVLWTNAGAGSGNVRWYGVAGFAGDTDNWDTGALLTYNPATAAPAQNVLKQERWGSSLSNVSGDFLSVRINRWADNAGDTLGNDIAVVGALLTRAS